MLALLAPLPAVAADLAAVALAALAWVESSLEDQTFARALASSTKS